MFKNSWLALLLLLVSGIAYMLLGYFTPRTDLLQLIVLFGVLFGAYFVLIRSSLNLRVLFLAAVLFRLLLFGMTPNLSDDYHRFLWDGMLWLEGFNPYLELPATFINTHGDQLPMACGLMDQMNSPQYYTIYPPLSQYVFALSVWFGQGEPYLGIIFMRLALIMVDCLNILMMILLLRHFGWKMQHLVLYALNPLVIMELTGNLHFEGMMLFFVLLGIYLLVKQRWQWSAVAVGLAVSTKLIPLLFLPFLFRRLGWQKTLLYCLIMGGVVMLTFLPFLEWRLFQHFYSSIDLYFRKFEFNASVYYVLRAVGQWITGYNLIAFVGPGLSLITLAGVAWMAQKETQANWRNLPQVLLGALLLYFSLALVVHPWYVATLVGLNVFVRTRIPVVWSAMIILSYATYRSAAYDELLWLTGIEYAVVFGLAYYEWKNYKAVGSLLPAGEMDQ